MLKTVLLAASIGITTGIYYPLFKRLLKRKSSRDFSLTSAWFVLAIQINGFFLAVAEKAPFLEAYYVLQIVLGIVQLWLINKFWNTLPPLMRSKDESLSGI